MLRHYQLMHGQGPPVACSAVCFVEITTSMHVLNWCAGVFNTCKNIFVIVLFSRSLFFFLSFSSFPLFFFPRVKFTLRVNLGIFAGIKDVSGGSCKIRVSHAAQRDEVSNFSLKFASSFNEETTKLRSFWEGFLWHTVSVHNKDFLLRSNALFRQYYNSYGPSRHERPKKTANFRDRAQKFKFVRNRALTCTLLLPTCSMIDVMHGNCHAGMRMRSFQPGFAHKKQTTKNEKTHASPRWKTPHPETRIFLRKRTSLN